MRPDPLYTNISIPDLVETIRIHLGMAPSGATVGPDDRSVIEGFYALDALLRRFNLDPYTIYKDISPEQKQESKWLIAYKDEYHRLSRRTLLNRLRWLVKPYIEPRP